MRILVLKDGVNVCKACAVYKNLLRTLQAAIINNSHLIKNLYRLTEENLGFIMLVSADDKNACFK